MSDTRRSAIVVAGICLFIGAVLYPVAFTPLASREVKEFRDGEPGFKKKGMWKALEDYKN